MSINRTRIKIVLVMFIGFVSIFVFSLKNTIQRESSYINKLKITTSFYPLAFLAERIGGDYVMVTNLTPTGAEPHDFEPSTRNVVELENQDIIFLNGGGIEGYADSLKKNINSKQTLLIVAGEPFISNPKDPHIWLDPTLYIKEAEVVAHTLIQKDPFHARIYTQNLKNLTHELTNLDHEFEKGLHACAQRNIITSHNAFGYLAKKYQLNEISLAGLSPQEEPSSKTLSNIASFAKKNTIKYILFEELVSPSVAETIAREVGAQTLVLNPLEGLTKKNEMDKRTYISIQQENLENLKIALNCK